MQGIQRTVRRYFSDSELLRKTGQYFDIDDSWLVLNDPDESLELHKDPVTGIGKHGKAMLMKVVRKAINQEMCDLGTRCYAEAGRLLGTNPAFAAANRVGAMQHFALGKRGVDSHNNQDNQEQNNHDGEEEENQEDQERRSRDTRIAKPDVIEIEKEKEQELKERVEQTTFRDSIPLHSFVVGYMNSPNGKAPCRLTAFSKEFMERDREGLPFIKSIDDCFKNCMRATHGLQLAEARKANRYRIAETAFSTMTVNCNFRTGLHKDSGDFKLGFGNLVVLSQQSSGGLLLFPAFKAALKVYNGDFVAMDVHEYHANSP